MGPLHPHQSLSSLSFIIVYNFYWCYLLFQVPTYAFVPSNFVLAMNYYHLNSHFCIFGLLTFLLSYLIRIKPLSYSSPILIKISMQGLKKVATKQNWECQYQYYYSKNLYKEWLISTRWPQSLLRYRYDCDLISDCYLKS